MRAPGRDPQQDPIVSQPSAGLLLQSLRPLAQVIWQVPMLQLPPVVSGRSVQLRRMPGMHELPHDVSLQTFSSQPSPVPPVQSRKPGMHVMLHEPLLQVPPVVFARSVQLTRPLHPVPQLLFCQMFVSQPLAAPPPQSAHPGSHEPMLHAPAVQLPSVTCGSASQSIRPMQPRPHELSAKRLASQPFITMPSQSIEPTSQVAMVHVPDAQSPLATFGSPSQSMRPLQPVPQEVSVQIAVSHPFAEPPLQSAKPALQVMLHVPATQVPAAVALGRVAQSIRPLQPVPQLLLLQMFVSHPALAVQSPKPGSQVFTTHAPLVQEVLSTLGSAVQFERPPHVVPHAVFV